MKTCWAALFVFMAVGLSGCPGKVPIRENRAQFEVASSHWFANEKTQYVFFSVNGLRASQSKLNWPLAFQISTPGAVIPGHTPGKDGFVSLDYSKAVHRHRLVECGEGKVCGSFSFHSESPVQRMNVRFLYNTGGSMNEVANVATAIHPEGQGADSQSALVYGVYNGDNTRVQVRVHDNFGTPDSTEIRNFGMERTFKISGLSAAALTAQDENSIRADSGTPLLFPAKLCSGKTSGTPAWQFTGRESWSSKTFRSDEPESDSCFVVDSLDRTGAVLASAPGIARKNPVFNEQPLAIRPPLKKTWQIPVVLSYCLDAPDAGKLTSADFLRYQYFILGVNPKAGIDACFRVGEENQFARNLEGVFNRKLAEARATVGAEMDFFFTIIINHDLAPDDPVKGTPGVRSFHKIIAATLKAKIASEVRVTSPRLVGAFVYDSQIAPDVDPGANVTWCPKKEREPGRSQDNPDANCTPRGAGDVSLGPFNFLIPMGPFPTLAGFLDYYQKYGDRGETTDPQFLVNSVWTNSNSMTNNLQGKFFTFLDGERLSLSGSEHLKFCRDRDTEGLFDQLAFRQKLPSGKEQVLSADTAQQVLMSNENGESLSVGLWWESPYIGMFSFNSPVRGKVLSVIPISTTLANRQKLGDPRWSRAVWNMTPLLQKCVRHCGHPIFDEAGVYQVEQPWDRIPQCPSPKTPELVQ